MNISYTWRNSDKTDAIEELTSKKLEKLNRHFDKIVNIHITFDLINKIDHSAKATLHLPGSEVNAHAESKDMYKAVDLLVDRLMRQVDEYKEKMKAHRD